MRSSGSGIPAGDGLPEQAVVRYLKGNQPSVVHTGEVGAQRAADEDDLPQLHADSRVVGDLPEQLLLRERLFCQQLEDKVFSDVVTLKLLVRAQDEAALIKQMQSTLDGKAEIALLGEEYKAWDE